MMHIMFGRHLLVVGVTSPACSAEAPSSVGHELLVHKLMRGVGRSASKCTQARPNVATGADVGEVDVRQGLSSCGSCKYKIGF